jgi:hypothetical protein
MAMVARTFAELVMSPEQNSVASEIAIQVRDGGVLVLLTDIPSAAPVAATLQALGKHRGDDRAV